MGAVHVVKYTDERAGMLRDIKIAQDSMEWFLDSYNHAPGEYDNDFLSVKSIAAYYQRYFFSRGDEMDYTINAKNTTIFELLSQNRSSTDAYAERRGAPYPRIMRQAFAEAGSRFEAIESGDTLGLIVPYNDAAKSDITVLQNSRDFAEIRGALRRLQRYTVNMYRNAKLLRDLLEMGAVAPALGGEAYVLGEGYYGDYGVSDTIDEKSYADGFIWG